MTDATHDSFYNGQVQIVQPAQGFRAGTDSLLLAAGLDANLVGSALEIGCGAGGALLPAAYRMPQARLTGLEIDPEMATFARQGIAENGIEARVEVVDGDAGALPETWQNKFDTVFSNPPFFEPGTIRTPGAGKKQAYIESLGLKDWVNAMLFALRPKGTFVMVHRAAELAHVLAVIERQTGEITVRPIHSYPGADAKRVLVRARKGLRSGPMRLMEPHYLFREKGGEFTDWALTMQRDGQGLAW